MERIDAIITEWTQGDPDAKLDLSALGLTEWPKKLTKNITSAVLNLDISNNNIKEIPRLERCEILKASNCKLAKLGVLPKIRELDVRNNDLTKLPGLSKAQRVLVSDNKLNSLPRTVNKLEILDVSNNQKLTTLPPKLPKLRVLLCANCDLASIPPLPKLEAISYYGNESLDVPALVEEVLIFEEGEELDETELFKLAAEKPIPKKRSPKRSPRRPSPKKSTKKSPRKILKPTLVPEEPFEEDEGFAPPKARKAVAARPKPRKKTPRQDLKVIKKETRADDINLWNRVPKTFGPISFIPLAKIETDIQAPIKSKKIKSIISASELEITSEIVKREEIEESEIVGEEETLNNIGNFMTLFEIEHMPRVGMKGIKRYKADELREFMKMLGLTSGGYNSDKIRLTSEYVRLSAIIEPPLDSDEEKDRTIVVSILRIKKHEDETNAEAIIRWNEKQSVKLAPKK